MVETACQPHAMWRNSRQPEPRQRATQRGAEAPALKRWRVCGSDPKQSGRGAARRGGRQNRMEGQARLQNGASSQPMKEPARSSAVRRAGGHPSSSRLKCVAVSASTRERV
eukprot:3776253-Pleurochrysis_carterae.AAC.3